MVIGATLKVKDVNGLILQKCWTTRNSERATPIVMRSLYDRYHGDAAA